MKFRYEEFDLTGVKTYPLASRKSKARKEDFARPLAGEAGAQLIDSLPSILGGADLKAVAGALRAARDGGHGIVWGLGAHVLKTGLSPIVIDLMERGFVSALALNGAGVIHDFELALSGATSEDVDEALGPGRFGMAEETGRELNAAINTGVERGLGFGQSVVKHVHDRQPPFANVSILAAAGRLEIPVTVHVAIGTDIIHMHPRCDGAALGAASMRDFRTFTQVVASLTEGGAYLNFGSAVLLPEVFLKALSVARNLGYRGKFVTADFDFIRHYRPRTNVVFRPHLNGGRGYMLTGHHELMIPLLVAGLREALA